MDRGDPAVSGIAQALWVQGEGRRAAAELRDVGVRVLLLKGPDLQSRLYGTPAAYASGDVDVLVPPTQAASAMRALRSHGWSFSPDNGVLWRFSRAAAFDRSGFRLDLHWGLHAAHLPAWSLKRLERRLWSGAAVGSSGMLEPDPESLVVFLAVHVVGHHFERPDWAENVHRAAALVRDWPEVWRIARAAHVEGAVRAALGEGMKQERTVPVLDGVWGRTVSGATWLLRGHFIPSSARARLRESVALAREGFGFWRVWRSDVWKAGGLTLVSPPGVFRAWELSAELADAGLAAIADRKTPIVVDVGTGSGAVALSIAKARPDAFVAGTDSSPRAIRAARRNRARCGLEHVRFAAGNLLDPLPDSLRGRIDLVVSNIPTDPPSVRGSKRDPRRTLVGPGADGLDLAWLLARQGAEALAPNGRLVLMLRSWQFASMLPGLRSLGYVEVGTTPCKVRPHEFCCLERRGNDA